MIEIKTNVKITVRDLKGNIKEVKEFHNLITTVGLNMLRDMIGFVITDAGIHYLAVGDDATAPAIGQTILVNETFRKAVTSRTYPAAGQVNTITYISPAEAVGLINELGWFAGVGAGAGADTGIMLSRVLYNRTKTALESIQCEYLSTFAEA